MVSTGISGNTLTLTYATGASGSANLTITATDTTGLTVSAPLAVTVQNGSLRLNPISNQSVNPGGTVAFTASAPSIRSIPERR